MAMLYIIYPDKTVDCEFSVSNDIFFDSSTYNYKMQEPNLRLRGWGSSAKAKIGKIDSIFRKQKQNPFGII